MKYVANLGDTIKVGGSSVPEPIPAVPNRTEPRTAIFNNEEPRTGPRF